MFLSLKKTMTVSSGLSHGIWPGSGYTVTHVNVVQLLYIPKPFDSLLFITLWKFLHMKHVKCRQPLSQFLFNLLILEFPLDV